MTNVVFQKAFDQSPSNLSSSDQLLCNFLHASEPLSPPTGALSGVSHVTLLQTIGFIFSCIK